MKLTHVLALVAFLLSGAAQVQADTNNAGLQQVSTTRKTATSAAIDPIPGVDIIVKKKQSAKSSISDQSAGGNSPRMKAPISDQSAGGNSPRTGPANISDQSAGGNISSYGKGTSGGTVTPGPRPADSAMQDVSTTRKTATSMAIDPIPGVDIIVKKDHAAPQATIDWGDGSPANAGSKKAGKPVAPAISDRWGNYSASNPAANTASPQKDAERNPAQATAAARDKYNAQSGAGNIAGPTPLMNGPNAGLVMPATLSPTMQGPLMAPGGAMSPGGH